MTKFCYTLALFVSFIAIGCSPFAGNALRKSAVIREEGRNHLSEEASAPPSVDASTRHVLHSYGSTIKRYSRQYGFDWRLVLAVIRVESSFRHSAESHRGAEGLMQVMPHTQLEIARKLAIEDIAHPKNNIRAGVYYMYKMYRMFDGVDESNRIRLTIAAYNAGPGRVFDAQKVARYLDDEPMNWQSVKDAMPLLSERFRTLHQNVWQAQKLKPFNNYGETISHVEKVMACYDEYRLVLN
jgi:membrane-bound lytic murein transglycosylase F